MKKMFYHLALTVIFTLSFLLEMAIVGVFILAAALIAVLIYGILIMTVDNPIKGIVLFKAVLLGIKIPLIMLWVFRRHIYASPYKEKMKKTVEGYLF